GVEGAVFAVMPKFGVRNVEHDRISDCGPIRVMRQKYELCGRVDKFPDQPGTGDPVDLCFLASDPIHGLLNPSEPDAASLPQGRVSGLGRVGFSNDSIAIGSIATVSPKCQGSKDD